MGNLAFHCGAIALIIRHVAEGPILYFVQRLSGR